VLSSVMRKIFSGAAAATPAAIYLRMSTESQNYSIDHQRAAITQYASVNRMTIVREYADEGKSGLDIRRRAGLLQLIIDVQAGDAGFEVVIVYDVSRWGRFQDVDEAAYHEHTCRRAGIAVVYCAETFQNDGSPMASLLKGIKRAMAAEYSRELSGKVFGAQCRFISMGYKQGGHAGYGLRRILLAADGTPRRALSYGEIKGTLTDRVVLGLGPAHEIAIVRRMYRLYTEDRASEPAIARLLNAEGIESEFGRPWTQCMVKSVLTNVKYIGTLVYNRRSGKLSNRREHNEVEDWIINEGAIPRLLPQALFKKAQVERERRIRRYGPDELLGMLRNCHKRHGKITAPIITADNLMPDPQLFARTFGSLVTAYRLAGLPNNAVHDFVERKSTLLGLRKALFNEVRSLASRQCGSVEIARLPFTLIMNGEITVRVDVVPYRQPVRGSSNWKVPLRAGVNFVVAARHDPATGNLLDFFLLPESEFAGYPIYIKACNISQFDSMRHASIGTMRFSETV
jgi:DNA invertase Pin-like site-specific DNA recombinase